MKIRLILLSLLGIAAYIVLANYNSKMLKDSVPESHTRASVPQPHPTKSTPPTQQTEPTQIAAPLKQADKLPEATPAPKMSAPSSLQVTVQPQAINTEQLQAELAQKEQQIRQLLDAQEALAAKSRSLMTLLDAGTADVATKDRLLQAANEQIKTLTADKDTTTSELERAKSTVERLNTTLKNLETAGIHSEQFIKEKETLLKTVQQQLQERNAEADSLKTQLADSANHLQASRVELETAGTHSKQLIKEKEALLKTVQQQLQERNAEADSLKTQLADSANHLQAARADLEQAELKATSLLRLVQEKEKLTTTLEQQKNGVEMSLQEKTQALSEALHTIQSLKQEAADHPQALAAVQNMLDERNREFDQLKEANSAQIAQLSQQVADLNKRDKQAAAEFNKCKTEVSGAQKKVTELESNQALAQTALKEVEQKLAAALNSTNTLQNQLNEKDAAISANKVQMNELLTKTSALNDAKIGLTMQLEALQADQKNLQGIKASCDEKSAALTGAETKLKELTALQARNAELTKSLEEKTAALADAVQQGKELAALQTQVAELQTKNKELIAQSDANTNTIKQLEAEKAGLAGQAAAPQAETVAVETLKKSLNEKTNALLLAETKIKELAKTDEQISTLQAKLKDATAAQQAMQNAKHAAEQKVAESESSLKTLNQSLAASNSKEKTLAAELTATHVRIKELMDKNYIQQQQDLVPNLNQQIATLRNQVAQMVTSEALAKKNLAEMTAATQTTDKKIQALQQEKEGLQKQLDELKSQAQPTPPQPAATLSPSTIQDRDKDGVTDTVDLCPDSPVGVPVNVLGCPEKKGIILEGVTFKSNTAILLPDGLKTLDRIAASLAQLSQVKIEIAGHTDSVGDPKRNQDLSTLRAQAVVKYLAEKGVAIERLTAKGYGQEKPIADNTTSVGKQKNRRVELYLMAP